MSIIAINEIDNLSQNAALATFNALIKLYLDPQGVTEQLKSLFDKTHSR